jgi:hypothetical protein
MPARGFRVIVNPEAIFMNERLEELRTVSLRLDDEEVEATLEIPAAMRGLVVMAEHSCEVGWHLAEHLERAGIGVVRLPMDREDAVRTAARLGRVLDITRGWAEERGVPVGLLGWGPFVEAAVSVAAERPWIGAVVTQDGDLAAGVESVASPLLVVMGDEDEARVADQAHLLAGASGPARLALVPGATRAFSGIGVLDEAAEIAAGWFYTWLGAHDAA